jgi:plasmid stabilization system protein ParE
MRIITKPLFKSGLKDILSYISHDSKVQAKQFNKTLFVGINSLEYFPYKFRKSLYFDNEHIRDYVFKGYIIPYLIDKENDVIVVLDIFTWIDK